MNDTVYVAALQLVTVALVVWGNFIMPRKGANNVQSQRKVEPNAAEAEDPTTGIGGGDFAELPREFEAALGAVIRVCVRNGGYFGLSVTDDGGSAKLVVRAGRVTVERRFYKLVDLTDAIAKVFTRLRDV